MSSYRHFVPGDYSIEIRYISYTDEIDIKEIVTFKLLLDALKYWYGLIEFLAEDECKGYPAILSNEEYLVLRKEDEVLLCQKNRG